MRLSRFSRRAMLSYLRHFYGVFKDLHFGWFVLVPFFSSGGSLMAGLAEQTGWLTSGLALIAVLSLAAILFKPKASLLEAWVAQQLKIQRAKLSTYLLPDKRKNETAVHIPILPDRPHLRRAPRERDGR